MISKRLEQRLLRATDEERIPTQVRVRYTLVMNTETKDVAAGTHAKTLLAYLEKHRISYVEDPLFLGMYTAQLTRKQVYEVAKLNDIRDMVLGKALH